MLYEVITDMKRVYASMYKHTDEDIYNCSACGYNRCENMAYAVYNGLNKPENCHYYKTQQIKIEHDKAEKNLNLVNEALNEIEESNLSSLVEKMLTFSRITSYNVCYTKLLRGGYCFT